MTTISGTSSSVDIYNLVSKTWFTALLSTPRASLSSASVGNVIFFAGGYDGTSRTAAVDIYSSAATTSAPATSSAPPLPSSSLPFHTAVPPSDSQSSGPSGALSPSAIAGISIAIILSILAVFLFIFRRRAKKALSSCCGCCFCCLAADREESQFQLKQKLHAVGDTSRDHS